MTSRPLSLYRSLLRAHKKYLPTEMQQLGDAYVKSEFKLHKAAKTEQVERFFLEWERYLDQILMTARAQESRSLGSIDDKMGPEKTGGQQSRLFAFGSNLSPDVELSEEQIQQLEKLRTEALNEDVSKNVR